MHTTKTFAASLALIPMLLLVGGCPDVTCEDIECADDEMCVIGTGLPPLGWGGGAQCEPAFTETETSPPNPPAPDPEDECDVACARAPLTCDEMECGRGEVCLEPPSGSCCEDARCELDPDLGDRQADGECYSCEELSCGEVGLVCFRSDDADTCPSCRRPSCEEEICPTDPPTSCDDVVCDSGFKCVERDCCGGWAACEPVVNATCRFADESATACSPGEACGEGYVCGGDDAPTDAECASATAPCGEGSCSWNEACVNVQTACGLEARCQTRCDITGCGTNQVCGPLGICKTRGCDGTSCQCLCDDDACADAPLLCLPG